MRLWAYAISMTLAALAAGTLGVREHLDARKLRAGYAACARDLEPVAERARVAEARVRNCEDDILAVTATAQANDRQLAKMQGNLSATRGELEALRAQRVEAEQQLEALAKLQEQLGLPEPPDRERERQRRRDAPRLRR